ncbi:unnamed protein product (macronuclear) [Paramecium tetraurelia]|uniref:PSI domain-containing protein n=1 Tax=Paramecium tetraurelia TaxID=5888 RepID=A0CUU7_PARTE|nr:uncharacterized protein GSPATT00039019001 [Paramecium tetraurelia]CAK74564.1 unnamed protein product [Paramecium tetraurelia]|eukprot:XP_001441961.1 hypothetical protein (macronuclear) [Paramecium tetraurelia strain d4-2]
MIFELKQNLTYYQVIQKQQHYNIILSTILQQNTMINLLSIKYIIASRLEWRFYIYVISCQKLFNRLKLRNMTLKILILDKANFQLVLIVKYHPLITRIKYLILINIQMTLIQLELQKLKDLNMFYYLLFYQLCVILSSEISKKCVCGHVRNEKECKNSDFCIWEVDKCILKPGQTYNKEMNNLNQCKRYAQEDCREQEKCGFYFGQCIDFVDCMVFDKDNCQESSYKCVSDGSKCVQIQECGDYKTENGCANKNKYKKYCFWIGGMERKCIDVITCEDLPIYLTNHQMCKSGLDGCTISENGYGCIKQMDLCPQYLNEFQCFESKKNNCFWDAINEKCVEKVCENLLFTQDYECKEILSNCTTNGVHCVKRKQCSDAQNLYGCLTDSEGKKCEYHQNQCKIKSCSTAPDSLRNYQQCQDYDNLLDCVTSENQGCKIRPETCNGYAQEMDCYSIEQQDCVWYKNKCEQRQCYHAPVFFTHADCHQYGNCIGKLKGGCEMTPQLCEEILVKQFLHLAWRQVRIVTMQKIEIANLQKSSTDCTQMITKNQCQLNLQDGTNCFWTGTKCKKQQCLDAPKVNYTNNVECNTWLNICIFDHYYGGCKDRPSPLACSSSPNNIMYNNHQECFAWNPKCTVISSFNAEGCEPKKANCHEFIRQRNCKTNINGQFCYWDDKLQMCMNEDEENNGIADCDKRLYGDLTHQDCEEFMPKCTINNIGKFCSDLQWVCEYYKYQQQCVIDKDYSPCKWDNQNQICKSVVCTDNTTAQTEAECIRFRFQYDCQLKIKSNGTYGPGCEKRPNNCWDVTDPIVCKLTLTYQQTRCYYLNSQCFQIQSSQCELITDSQSNELCQYYNPQCVLQPSGQGCYSINSCNDLSNKVCNSSLMRKNQRCIYQDKCNEDICSSRYVSQSSCSGQKTQFGISCLYTQCPSSSSCGYQCINQTQQTNLTFPSTATLQDKRVQCQSFSSLYRYDTSCNCCILLTQCSLQVGPQSLCNLSINQSGVKCGYNLSNNTCQERICSHLNSSYALSQLICYNWGYNCVYDVTGCKTFSGDFSTISLIQQCYSNPCFWYDGKCVNYVNCELNTTAVTNRECLLNNSSLCRLNHALGKGCAFTYCEIIYHIFIMEKDVSGSPAVAGEKHVQVIQYNSDCENSYGYIYPFATKCYWCSLQNTKCSNNKYCSLASMTTPQTHEDCNSNNVAQTIQLTMSSKCTLKQQQCSNYTYKEACVKTIDNIECYWNSNACINYCDAAAQIISTWTHSSCQSWKDTCMSLNNLGCQLLDCSLLTTIEDCTIFNPKCFWDGSTCQTISDCSRYSDTLCLNTSNSLGIPCFWDGTQCLEKTCSNKPTSSIDQTECDDWLTNCQWNSNNNQCVEDCSQANISNNTHQLCESYYLNKSCTVKVDRIQCVDLPFSCLLAKKTQCYKDQFDNECYYQDSSNQCVNLLCSNLEASFTTHEKCNQRLNSCTVNITLNGCQELNNCSSYSIVEQQCEWIISSNTCTIKECSTAQLNDYSANSCQQYFGDSCTVNDTLNGCEIGQIQCLDYTYNQCNSEGQMNLSGVNCFWNENKSICMERICKNGPPLAQSHGDCIVFLSTCQKSSCRRKECFDYNYAIDSACASIFEDKRCVTNGYQCILRGGCEDIIVSDGCTFDIKLNACVWIDEKCYTKSCETASVSIIEYQECNAYFPSCTAKQGGGCTKKQKCQNYQIKEACYTDSENLECIWDDYLNQCFSNQCIDFCGDGIISSREEECDDGNYLPYDGCYKCQIQCPLGYL